MAKRILIVKLGAIGDVVVATTLLPAIKTDNPDNEITWVCGKTVAPLLKLFSDIDRLLVVDDQALLSGSPVAQLLQIAKAWKQLLFEEFDYVITPYRDARYKLLTLPVKKKVFRSFMYPGERDSITAGRYFATEYVRLFTDIEDYRTEFPVYPTPIIPLSPEIEKLLPAKTNKRIVLFPGGAKNILNDDDVRRCPVEKYREVAEKLLAAGYSVILPGAKSDAWAGDAFNGLPVTNLIGKTSIPDLLCILKGSDALVCHDTGILHMAKLTGTPTVGLFGPRDPRELMNPSQNGIALWGGECLPCAPCYNGKIFAACKNNICMRSISPDLILQSLRDLFEKNNKRENRD